MTRQVVAYRTVRTDRSLEEVLRATEDGLRMVGGSLYRTGEAINVQNGTSGVSLAMAGDVNARATVQARSDGGYQITCTITISPNTTFWVCAIVGFLCLYPLWIVNLFYFLMDPLPVYQRALDQIDLGVAGGARGGPPPVR